jgi:hypothetical protein
MKHMIMYFAIYSVVLFGIWGVGTLFADSISDHEVISPEQGVKCVVVSRMFNTSVDCWTN